jgi:hypothetical protein
MDQAARHFLADAALSRNQDLGVAPRRVLDLGPDGLHRRTDTDEVVDGLFHSVRIPAAERPENELKVGLP